MAANTTFVWECKTCGTINVSCVRWESPDDVLALPCENCREKLWAIRPSPVARAKERCLEDPCAQTSAQPN